MSDFTPTPESDSPSNRHFRRHEHGHIVLIAFAVIGLVAWLATKVTAMPGLHGSHVAHHGCSHGTGDQGCPHQRDCGSGHGCPDANEVERHVEALLDAVDATERQRADVAAAMDRIDTTRTPEGSPCPDLMAAIHEHLGSATVDGAKLEQARLAAVRGFDDHSKQLVARATAIASSLTAEQRAILADTMTGHHAAGGHGH